MAKRRVVVTGWSQTSPLGTDVAQFVERCYTGVSGFRPISLYETKGSSIRYAGEHDAPDVKALSDRKFQKVLSRRDQASVLAGAHALKIAGLAKWDVAPERIGIFVGVSCSHLGDLTPYMPLVASCGDLQKGTFDSNRFGLEFMETFNPLVVLKLLMNNALCYGTISSAIQGVNSNYMQHEVSGLRALGEAFLAIEEGRADVALAGGAASQVEPFQMLEAFHFGLLADQSEPSFDARIAVKPYDEASVGTILSEGSAYLVLEDEVHAQKRGATVLGRVVGFGLGADGQPDDEAGEAPSKGLLRAMNVACERAGTRARDLAFIAGNGSGVRLSDRREALTYLDLLGDADERVSIYSIKAVTGEVGEASGVLAAVTGLSAFGRGVVPPTWNLTKLPVALAGLGIRNGSQPLRQRGSGGVASVVSRSRFGVSAVLLLAPP